MGKALCLVEKININRNEKTMERKIDIVFQLPIVNDKYQVTTKDEKGGIYEIIDRTKKQFSEGQYASKFTSKKTLITWLKEWVLESN